ncbi:hypothetical protein D8674_013178 [Pyrus ussuriensis x Pyrus communis]|uniref:Uncharacterized protein n=1 Tax=Pyrus ussuriensis x Pyrus communis TaxID=2448454 RepID=A0A5N5GP31_9ROSA|nr:hypothetical protein D8674_013178 [Pyrus ussuriensis x Pyrus communis]
MLGVQVPPLRRCRSASERCCRQIRLLIRQNHLRIVKPVLTATAVSVEELRWQLGGREAFCSGHVQHDKEIVEEHRSPRASRRGKMGAH